MKLDAMENPYPLPDALRRELGGGARARRRSTAIRRRARRSCATRSRARMSVPAGMEVLLGNGSDELIQMLITALARPGAAMMYPSPTFVMYSMGATFSGMRAVAGAAARGFLARRRRVHRAHAGGEAGAGIPRLPEQSRPACSIRKQDVVEDHPRLQGLVVVDEAYHVFAGKSFMPRLAEFDNLVVMRTVSKLGLAGIRLGYLVGRPEWVGAARQGAPALQRERAHAGGGAVHARAARGAGGAGRAHPRRTRAALGEALAGAARASRCFRRRRISS